MEIWFLIVLTISIAALIRAFLNLFSPSSPSYSLPPGPFTFPVIGNIKWMNISFSEVELLIRSLHKKLGPIITLHIGSRPSIFIADHSLTHQALVQNGSVFSNRPLASATSKITTANQSNISSASYGPNWRLLRRNLTSEILHPSRVRSYSHARKSVLEILLNSFETQSSSGGPVTVIENVHYAMFCLLVFMCLGDKLDEKQIKKIARVERSAIVNSRRFDILNYWPAVTKVLMKKRWSEFLKLQKDRGDVMLPLIRARKKLNEKRMLGQDNQEDEFVLSYVDTLFNLELPGEKRKLTETELLTLCNEFLNGGTDTTSTALQWVMANLVKYPDIQEKLFTEIKQVHQEGREEVEEEEVQKMPYLKAIILEGLRRHPPAHLVLAHTVSEDVILANYLVPKTANVNFMVAEMGWDPKVWEDPMAFKPERFVGNNEFDITGSREIKMMPFGVGRRICPGYGLALLHLEYFVANLVWKYKWKAVNDVEDVDLSEKQEFTVVMKTPLKAYISPRFK
ncbi:Cytochrome P450 superfamily protein [Euphorbia peplus]|nr:Cytochrome P450 superfamily protein [Euphorbia peplus]